MVFGPKVYTEGVIPPQRGGCAPHNWHVRCTTGALEVLATREYVEWLAKFAGHHYTINFANGSCASISPEHPLWIALKKVAEDYSVSVFSMMFNAKDRYVPWTDSPGSPNFFDAICIEVKKPVEVPVKKEES